MKHSVTINGYTDPFMMSMDWTFKCLEMIMDSANVVSQRAGLALVASPIMDDDYRSELFLMVQEKVDAAEESVQAVMAYMMAWNRQLGAQSVKHVMALATAMILPTDSRALGKSLLDQVEFVFIMGETAIMTTKVSDNVINLAHRGLKPFHSRVMANVKRLAGG
ncbi:MAG: hypothetical protein CSYNP_00769 [Syntrophus sp. SKADARSKE-3]|nr:hypothetical protein [Syntrophus sp. SKADARSKE-3]